DSAAVDAVFAAPAAVQESAFAPQESFIPQEPTDRMIIIGGGSEATVQESADQAPLEDRGIIIVGGKEPEVGWTTDLVSARFVGYERLDTRFARYNTFAAW